MEQFWVIFGGAIGTIATGLAAWLTTVMVNWLNRKIKDKKLEEWSCAVATIVMGAVQAVTQEFVDTLKKNGKFDETAQKQAKEKAYKIIVAQLSQELKKYITDNFGDMKAWIETQIESYIYQLKR